MSSLHQYDLYGNNLWKGAHEVKLPCGAVLQVQGIASPTRTAFGRLIVLPDGPPTHQDYHLTVQQVVQYMLEEIQHQRQEEEEEIKVSAKELLSLGSVWRLTKEPQSDKKWKRTRLLSQHADDKLPFWDAREEPSLRVHYFPSRFPAVNDAVDWTLPPSSDETTTVASNNNVNNTNNPRKPSAIRHYDSEFGYCVVHKPSGVPSHATVDNGVENALYQIQQQQQTATTCSLPQRLDIDTEGLLLVATKPEFASFIGRLLQAKTRSHAQPVSPVEETVSREATKPPPTLLPPTGSYIQKQYRCLVRVRSMQDRDILLNQLSQQLHKSQIKDNNIGSDASNETSDEGRVFPLHADLKPQTILVQHYTDPKASAPKPFVSQPKTGWHRCVLRILEVGPLLTWISSLNDNDNSNPPKEEPKTEQQFMMEVKVELITGRTHQIRGQFAALNLPLVGDPLYHHHHDDTKKKLEEVSWDKTRNRGTSSSKNSNKNTLALQCCSLVFPKPKWGTHPRTNRPFLEPRESAIGDVCQFIIEKAWWSDLVTIAAPPDSINI